ncbi:MAG: hypothetical protein K0S47_1199 [Herbinix sp.]|jgi:hypothetical protein|nr:hypothetical protein [Herbinix sp.]
MLYANSIISYNLTVTSEVEARNLTVHGGAGEAMMHGEGDSAEAYNILSIICWVCS